MKVINISYSRYEYPENINNLNEFIALINNSMDTFIPMKRFNEENCVFPYLVGDDVQKVYINFSQVTEVFEEDATILTRVEYDKRLALIVEEKCIDCTNYEDESLQDNLEGHRGNIDLDGCCRFYTKKEI